MAVTATAGGGAVGMSQLAKIGHLLRVGVGEFDHDAPRAHQ